MYVSHVLAVACSVQVLTQWLLLLLRPAAAAASRLTGTLPAELAFQSLLSNLRVQGNTGLRGTLSPWFRCVCV